MEGGGGGGEAPACPTEALSLQTTPDSDSSITNNLGFVEQGSSEYHHIVYKIFEPQLFKFRWSCKQRNTDRFGRYDVTFQRGGSSISNSTKAERQPKSNDADQLL